MTILINFMGAPSVGKSTTAGKLFARLKDMELNAELAQEFVKGWVYDEHPVGPYDQFYIFGKETHNQSRLFNKVDFIVADSPVMLTAFYQLYAQKENSLREICRHFYDMAERIDNVIVLNFLLTRKKRYQTKGRYHSQEQSDEIEKLLRCFLKVEGYPYIELDCPDSERVDKVMDILKDLTNNFEGMVENG